MAVTLTKVIATSKADLQEKLTSAGFTFSEDSFYWTAAGNKCKWKYDTELNFYNSKGEKVFYQNLTDWANGQYCAINFLPLRDGGCALCLSPVPVDTMDKDIQFCCANNYEWQENTLVELNHPFVNGLIVITPPEPSPDGKWRFFWRDSEVAADGSKKPKAGHPVWDVDNTAGYVSYGTEIPDVKVYHNTRVITLVKSYLLDDTISSWSTNFFVQVVGNQIEPASVVKIKGQEYVIFCDGNIDYRCPVFILPTDDVEPNDSKSTSLYSELKTYKIGDYCIYGDGLYKCIKDVTYGESFDENKWNMTTVPYEKENS